MRFIKTLPAFIFLLIANKLCEAQISGPATVTAGTAYTYTYSDGAVYMSPHWFIGNGTIISTQVSSLKYTVTVQFNCNATNALVFMNGSYGVANLVITLAGTVATQPVTNFTYAYGCGTTTVAVAGSAPPGLTWYWQTSATGTTTGMAAEAYFTSLAVTTPGTYYLRAQGLYRQLEHSITRPGNGKDCPYRMVIQPNHLLGKHNKHHPVQ